MKQYDNFQVYTFRPNMAAWVCLRGNNRHDEGMIMTDILRELFGDYAPEILNVITQWDFRRMTFYGVRIRNDRDTIYIEWKGGTFMKK